ncbi:MAG TPA: MarC family protein [Candidatus Saccharimonadales bacterium]|nr:MarC family protein [Candidatus Saccharimonadales bacterium]
MSWNELLFDFVTLWVTIDPIGTVPLYLSVTKDLPAQARKRAAMRATLVAFLILAGFLYLGQYLLEAMHVEMLSFQIAGGIVLFLFAVSMIFDRSSATQAPAEEGHDVAIFPLAMPSIATPGALLAVVVLTDNNTHSFLQETLTCLVMGLVLVATLVLMLLGDWFIRIIGRSGANVLSRVMGMILAAVAVEMVYSAFRGQLGPG